MKVLILGATGLVGQRTLVQGVTHPAITQVVAPTRRPLPPSSKLANPVAERLELLLPEVLTWGVDAVICALGTTSGKAGSKEVFRQVDYVLPLAFAKLAHQQGAETFALVSAIGADANSSILLSENQGRGREGHEARWLQIADDPPAQHHRWEARRVALCRRTCSDAVSNTGASSSEKVPCQSRSEDRRRSSRQRHCCGPGLSLSLRRKFGLVPWRNMHEKAFDADEYNVNRNSHHNGRKGWPWLMEATRPHRHNSCRRSSKNMPIAGLGKDRGCRYCVFNTSPGPWTIGTRP